MRTRIGPEGEQSAEGAKRPEAAEEVPTVSPEEVPIVPACGLEDDGLEDLDGVPGRMTLITGDGAGARGVKLEPGERWQDALRRLQQERSGTGRAYAIVLELLTAGFVLLGAG